MEKACQERSNAVAYLGASPVLERYRSDSRYRSLLDCIGLGQ